MQANVKMSEIWREFGVTLLTSKKKAGNCVFIFLRVYMMDVLLKTWSTLKFSLKDQYV